MIQRENVMENLISVCPSFTKRWEEHQQDIWDRESETILYTDFAEFAKHLLMLIGNNDFNEFKDIFDKVEYLLREGDSFVKEAITIGLLEDIQNYLLGNGYELEIIEQYLNPETKKYWVRVAKLWEGEITYIDNN